MDTSQNITPNTYASLKAECDELGISINRLCREADVDRSVIQRWKDKEPKSFETLNALKQAIERIKNANSNT